MPGAPSRDPPSTTALARRAPDTSPRSDMSCLQSADSSSTLVAGSFARRLFATSVMRSKSSQPSRCIQRIT